MDSSRHSHESEVVNLQEFSHSEGYEVPASEEDFAPGDQMEQTPVRDFDRNASPILSLPHGSSSSMSINSIRNEDRKPLPKWLGKLFDNMVSEYWTRKKQIHGWRTGCFLGCVMTFAVLSINIGLVLTGACAGDGFQDGFAVLNTGSASYLSRLSTFYHVLINVLSTILLSASNYVLQILCSPTREDLDKAHRAGSWLDVGVLSSRNIRHFPKRRTVMFLLLCLSSVPLHLFYNASIFKVIVENDYVIDFIHEASTQDKSLNRNVLSNISTTWQSIYNVEYPLGYANLSLVFDVGYLNNHSMTADEMSLLPFSFSLDDNPVSWRNPYISSLQKTNGSNWVTLRNILHDWNYADQYPLNITYAWNITVRITEAWAQKTPYSSLRISLPLMLIVIAFNVLKLTVMLSVLIFDREPRLATIGDAIASFLETPDSNTSGYCTISRDEYLWKFGHTKRPYNEEKLEKFNRRLQGYWDSRTKRHGSAIGHHRRMLAAFIAYGSVIGGFIIIFCRDRDMGGWGTSSTTHFTLGTAPFSSSGMLLNAFVGNVPQILFSICYLSLNSLFTSMAMIREYNDFAVQRKGLRVSNPRGKQRSSYFLQLPFRWAIPLNISGGLLHWLLSQTLFYTRIDKIGKDGELSSDSTSACGFSLMSAVALLATTAALLGVATTASLLNFELRMPFASSCSWVISAACHPPPEEDEPSLKRVKWGVVQSEMYSSKRLQHCSFSSRPVQTPEPDVRYE